MGKLHTLRRAIHRDPQEYIAKFGRENYARGAEFRTKTGQWGPHPFFFVAPYRGFVCHVLLLLGHNVR